MGCQHLSPQAEALVFEIRSYNIGLKLRTSKNEVFLDSVL